MSERFWRSGGLRRVLTPWLLAALAGRAPADGGDARQRLLDKGLTPVGQVWIASEETDLRRDMQGFEQVDRRLRDAIAGADSQLRQNETNRQWLSALEKLPADHKSRRSTAPPGSSASVAKSIEAGGLKSTMPDVTGVGEETPLQAAMVELVTARSAAALAVLSIDRRATALVERYATLAKDADVLVALKELGDAARLGPLRNYRGKQDRVEVVSQRVLTNRLPIYLECGRERLGVLLEDRLATTASLARGDAPTVLAASVAQSLGIPLDATARQRVRVAGRDVNSFTATLASLRVGGFLFKDVEVRVLPPEAEDLGNQIGEQTLKGMRIVVSPAKMEAVIESVESR